MNLEQELEVQGFTFFSPAFANLSDSQSKMTENGSLTHFSEDYVSIQEMTDGQRNYLCLNKSQLKQYSSADDYYIDQFLSFQENSSNLKQLTKIQYSNIQLSPLISSITPQAPKAYKAFNNSAKNSKKTVILPQNSCCNSFRTLSKDYNKNLAGYITKKAIRILRSLSYRKRLEKCCRSNNIEVPTILEYCNSRLSSISGPSSIFQFFSVTSEDERALKQVLMTVFMRILRRDYTLEILRDGRMLDYEAYIRIKNSHLLYFSQMLP